MSKLSNQGRIILAAIAILCGAMTEVRGGTIGPGDLEPGCGSVARPIMPGAIGKTFNEICSMDILFPVTNSGGPNLVEFRETVVNMSGQTWIDFHMQLGFGTGTGFTPANCGVGFTNLPRPSSGGVFTLQGVGSSTIDWGGGMLPTSGVVGFTFTVNVQDLSQCIPVGSQRTNGYIFTLRQTPTIPEPTTMLLLGTGLAGVAIKTRKRFKSRQSAKGRPIA